MNTSDLLQSMICHNLKQEICIFVLNEFFFQVSNINPIYSHHPSCILRYKKEKTDFCLWFNHYNNNRITRFR